MLGTERSRPGLKHGTRGSQAQGAKPRSFSPFIFYGPRCRLRPVTSRLISNHTTGVTSPLHTRKPRSHTRNLSSFLPFSHLEMQSLTDLARSYLPVWGLPELITCGEVTHAAQGLMRPLPCCLNSPHVCAHIPHTYRHPHPHTHVYVHMQHTVMYLYTYAWSHADMYRSTHITHVYIPYTNTHTDIYTYPTHMQPCTHIHTYSYIDMYMYTCTLRHIDTYIHMPHTFTLLHLYPCTHITPHTQACTHAYTLTHVCTSYEPRHTHSSTCT